LHGRQRVEEPHQAVISVGRRDEVRRHCWEASEAVAEPFESMDM
jgi:hypothetical protein